MSTNGLTIARNGDGLESDVTSRDLANDWGVVIALMQTTINKRSVKML